MHHRVRRILALAGLATMLGSIHSQAASAYLFWKKPDFTGAPVKGDEPGISLPAPGANEKETAALLLWNLRAGLNVAALKCQFAPILQSVPTYNSMLKHHAKELLGAYNGAQGYFKRTGGKTWQKTFDQYTTRTYNSFSTLYGEQGFCDTAAVIGRDAIARRAGDLHFVAETRMRELRNSLLPAPDGLSMIPVQPLAAVRSTAPLDPVCWDKKGRFNMRKCGTLLPPDDAPTVTAEAKAPGAS